MPAGRADREADAGAAAGSRSRWAAQTMGLLPPRAEAHATAASRAARAGVRVTRATTRKVCIPPAAMAAGQVTRPRTAFAEGLDDRKSRPGDRVCVTSRCGALTWLPFRTVIT